MQAPSFRILTKNTILLTLFLDVYIYSIKWNYLSQYFSEYLRLAAKNELLSNCSSPIAYLFNLAYGRV